MVYKAFNNVATTAYRPNYLRDEAKRYGKYGVDGKFKIEFEVIGNLHVNPGKHVDAALHRALENTARAAIGFVQPDTPVDTGLLRSRWYQKKVKRDEWRVSNDIFYAPFNEKRVMMLERNLPRIQAELIRQLNSEIPKALN